MTMAACLLPLMFLLFFTGLPIVYAVGITVVIVILIWEPVSMIMMFQQLFSGLNNFTLLAVPLFMISGEVMGRSGITDDILAFCDILVGKLKGGLGYVNIVANVFFAAISGSAIADMAAISPLLVPKMVERGYGKEFSYSLSAAAAVIGPIIPPSIIMVIYCASQNLSIGAMFMAGVVPGVLLALGLMLYVCYYARKNNVQCSTEHYTLKRAAKITVKSVPALLSPLIICGGIFSGMFSPTEAAAIICVYAIFLGVVYYRSMGLSDILDCISKGFMTAAPILLLVAVVKPLTWLIALAQLPAAASAAITSITTNPYIVLFLLNIVMLLLGCVMEGSAVVMIFAPIFAPLVVSMGVNPLHFGIVMCLNLVMGVATPPFGICLFLGSDLAKVPVAKLIKPILPMIAVEIIVLLLVTYISPLALALPTMLGY